MASLACFNLSNTILLFVCITGVYKETTRFCSLLLFDLQVAVSIYRSERRVVIFNSSNCYRLPAFPESL